MNSNPEDMYIADKNYLKAEMLAYLKTLKPYFIVITSLFILAIITGYIAALYHVEIVDVLLDSFQESYVDKLVNASPIEIMLFIFKNNIFVSFFAVVGGIFFGIISIGIILFNGFFIGAVVFELIQQYGGLVVMAGLIPHGIIELPMILISASIGLRLGLLTFQRVFKIKHVALKYELFKAIRFFILVIVPLLFIAAIIETYITSTIFYVLTSQP
jgi:stage II sporulation protein M